MPKKRALHLFLKITFFSSLLLLLTPETLPNHLFRQTSVKKIVEKSPERRKNFVTFFFIIFFTFSFSPYGNKQNLLLFPPFLSSEIEKPQGKTSHIKFFFFLFFFFLTFLHPTAPRNRENYHLPFFSKFRLKMPLNADKRDQVSFFTNYLFSAVITRTQHLPTHTPFLRSIMCKKRALHLFLKLLFFCSLLLLLFPETLPNHLFRQTSDQK